MATTLPRNVFVHLNNGGLLLLFQALKRIFGLRRYNGSIIFVPAPGYESHGEPLDLEKKIIIDGESEIKSEDGPVRDPEYGYQGPKVDIKSLNWRKIDGPFVSIWLHNVPWGSEDTMAAPDAEVCSIHLLTLLFFWFSYLTVIFWFTNSPCCFDIMR